MRDVIRSCALAAVLLGAPAVFAEAQAPEPAAGRDRQAPAGPSPTQRTSVPPPAETPVEKQRPAAPSAAHFFVPGYWAWLGDRHAYTKGHWEAPRPGQVYLAPQWLSIKTQWTFYPGYWAAVSTPPAIDAEPAKAEPGQEPAKAEPGQPAKAEAAKTEAINLMPPAPREEIPGTPPSPQHKWVGGHWRYQGGVFLWTPGMWVEPKEGWELERARWRGQGKEWRLVPAQWRKK